MFSFVTMSKCTNNTYLLQAKIKALPILKDDKIFFILINSLMQKDFSNNMRFMLIGDIVKVGPMDHF